MTSEMKRWRMVEFKVTTPCRGRSPFGCTVYGGSFRVALGIALEWLGEEGKAEARGLCTVESDHGQQWLISFRVATMMVERVERFRLGQRIMSLAEANGVLWELE